MSALPPLNALRAFEATGRHKSITAAADELHVAAHAAAVHGGIDVVRLFGTDDAQRLGDDHPLHGSGEVGVERLAVDGLRTGAGAQAGVGTDGDVLADRGLHDVRE